ncbi:MAG: ABC transporter permease subunit [Actinobacteria bacterium]|nr:ABC transporter permease subunit [Actinomycetota bacterium]
MIAFRAIFVTSLRQLFTRKRIIGFGLITLLPAVLVALIPASSADSPEELFLGIAVETLLKLVVPIIAIVLASGVLGDERTDKTLSFLTLRPISRFTIAGAKITATAAAASSFAAFGAILLGITYAVRGGVGGPTVGLIVSGVLSATLYTSLVTPLGYLTRRATILALSYLILMENVIISAVPAMASSSPWRVGLAGGGALLPSNFRRSAVLDTIGTLELNLPGAVIQVVGTGAVLTIILGLLLSRRDNV